MLPEFPSAQKVIQELWSERLFNAANHSDPLVSQVQIIQQKEGAAAKFGASALKYKRHRVTQKIEKTPGKGIATKDYFNLAGSFGERIASGQAREIFAEMKADSAKGGMVDFSSEPPTFARWLQLMEPIEVEFNEKGVPRWPQWFGPPELMAAFAKATDFDNLQPEEKALLTTLVEKKRREFHEREARRRLVD